MTKVNKIIPSWEVLDFLSEFKIGKEVTLTPNPDETDSYIATFEINVLDAFEFDK